MRLKAPSAAADEKVLSAVLNALWQIDTRLSASIRKASKPAPKAKRKPKVESDDEATDQAFAG